MNRTTSTKALPGWAVPLLFTVFSACVAPGKTPALGVELGSCGPEGLIDDGEDGNNQNKTTGGRGGYWYTFKDRTGSTTVSPEAGEEGGAFAMSERGANGSKFAAHVSGHVGQGDIVFGAMGMNFVDPMEPYDASAFKGVAFWAKRSPESYARVRFKVPDVATHEKGGVCTECFNDFGADLILSDSWQYFAFPWRKLRQIPGWGSPRPHMIKPAKLFGMQWQVNHPGADFDIWVDDVEFLCE